MAKITKLYAGTMGKWEKIDADKIAPGVKEYTVICGKFKEMREWNHAPLPAYRLPS